MNRLYLCYPKKTHTIRPELYGHFSEHIGGVFYDGLWVGRDSAIPNLNGFRREVGGEVRPFIPSAPVARGCFAETMTGGMVSVLSVRYAPTGGLTQTVGMKVIRWAPTNL